jgi:hypothetical protein
LTDAGNFSSSPAVFTDEINPAGTCYEGFIRSDCSGSGSGEEKFGTPVTWEACPEESGCNGNPITGALDNSTEFICGTLQEYLFLDNAHEIIQPGAVLYYDACLTEPVTGFLFVKDIDGIVFNLDIDEVIVGGPTGDAC